MMKHVAVVVPVHNGADTLADCLQALRAQSLPKSAFEIIVVDDGSTDASAEIARSFGVRLILQRNGGAASARNTGAIAARARWLAFTDADAIPSRNWLKLLLKRAEDKDGNIVAFGAAGPIRGHQPSTPAARFVDMSGALDTERLLKHPRFPFAPTANAMYLRELFLDAGGFDERFASYDACDLHLRLREMTTLPFAFEETALVLHRHLETWKAYWRQQRRYGVGYAQLLLRHRIRVLWGVARETRALWTIARNAVLLAAPASRDDAALRLGCFIRMAAQHIGFLSAFLSRAERRRWTRPAKRYAAGGPLVRCARALSRPGDLLLAVAIASFILRLPRMLAERDLKNFLRELDRTRGGRARLEKVLRVRQTVLRILHRSDTCYARAFTLYRFLAVAPSRIDLRQDRLRGRAWVLLDGNVLEGAEPKTTSLSPRELGARVESTSSRRRSSVGRAAVS